MLKAATDPADNDDMELILQWCPMALASTMILRLALAERARQVAALARARVDEGTVRR
ncbi:MAG: hypothetical protein QOI56_50 [Actinomycetota bacterium]|nr:hypothetical protein [Actinomycetota bacterium]